MTTTSSSQGRRQSAPLASSTSPPPAAFPIVGIGASAGGLEALEQFLRPAPADSGMAFVIVQHLDPTHPALLGELLQRTTRIPVEEVKDRVKVQPNHIYVIPPNHDLSLLHGDLRLSEPSSPRGLRLPIDFHMAALARPKGAWPWYKPPALDVFSSVGGLVRRASTHQLSAGGR